MNPPVFVIGRDYTRTEIQAEVGGSARGCLPVRGGMVRAACLLSTLNPDAPRSMLCGTGPRNGAAGVLLAEQRAPLPIFVKQGVNRWRYTGHFVPVESIVDGPRFEACLAASLRPRGSVSRVVLFEKV